MNEKYEDEDFTPFEYGLAYNSKELKSQLHSTKYKGTYDNSLVEIGKGDKISCFN